MSRDGGHVHAAPELRRDRHVHLHRGRRVRRVRDRDRHRDRCQPARAVARGRCPGRRSYSFIYQYGNSVAVSGNRMAVASSRRPAGPGVRRRHAGPRRDPHPAPADRIVRVRVRGRDVREPGRGRRLGRTTRRTFSTPPPGPCCTRSRRRRIRRAAVRVLGRHLRQHGRGRGKRGQRRPTGRTCPGRVGCTCSTPITGALQRTIVNPTPSFGEEQFASAIALDGNLLAVGHPIDHMAANLALGQVFLYDVTTGALLRTLNDPTLGSNNLFGLSVGVSGNRVVVGAQEAAYVFDAATGNLITHARRPDLLDHRVVRPQRRDLGRPDRGRDVRGGRERRGRRRGRVPVRRDDRPVPPGPAQPAAGDRGLLRDCGAISGDRVVVGGQLRRHVRAGRRGRVGVRRRLPADRRRRHAHCPGGQCRHGRLRARQRHD